MLSYAYIAEPKTTHTQNKCQSLMHTIRKEEKTQEKCADVSRFALLSLLTWTQEERGKSTLLYKIY